MKERNPGVDVIGVYVDANTPILHYCKKHKVTWNSRPASILSGSGCGVCKKEKFRMTRSKTHEEYMCELKKITADIVPLEAYITAKNPILHLCKKHGVEWSVSPDAVLNGHGCYLCGYEMASIKNTKALEQYLVELKNVHPNIAYVDGYTKATEKATHHCSICDYEWEVAPSYLLSGRGCPNCVISHGEIEVKMWLDSNNIRYKAQKRFPECRDKKELPFDFYLPDYNVAIEYDGEQHFRPIEYFGGDRIYETRIIHDRVKDDFCKSNGIELLRIPYYKNATSELNNFLLKIQ